MVISVPGMAPTPHSLSPKPSQQSQEEESRRLRKELSLACPQFGSLLALVLPEASQLPS